MFIKLNFTNGKSQYQLWRVVADIVATSSVTSIATLQTRATAAGYDSSLLQYLDASNSEIIRTTDTTGVTSHISANTATFEFEFTLQFNVYDSAGTYYYAQIFNNTASNAYTYYNVGTALTGGTISSSQIPVTAPDATNSYVGTQLAIGGTSDGNTSTYYNTNANSCATLWVYITPYCLMWYANNSVSTIGWSTSNTTRNGPFIIGQYTRYDYFNSMSNGIYPVMYSIPDRGSAGNNGSLQGTDFYTATFNPAYTTTTSTTMAPFRILNTLTVQPSSSAVTWSTSTKVSVCHTINGFSTGWKAPGTGVLNTTALTATYNNITSTTVGNKYPNSTLTTPVYIQFPIGWELQTVGAFGGNFSDKTGVYLFNGDYSLGDEYVVGSTTYSIWPLPTISTSITNRIALGVPKT